MLSTPIKFGCMKFVIAFVRRLTTFLLMLSVPAMAAAPGVPLPPAEYPVGRPDHLDKLPPGRFRAELEQLPPEARARAHQWLRSFHFPAQDVDSLHADADGGIFYVCQFQPPPATEPEEAGTEPPLTAEAAVPASPFPEHLKFHSRPGASNVLYLNFGGENVADTEWNKKLSRTNSPARAFSLDANDTTFSDTEQTAIKNIWQRVAEDYAPFDIDVTTERPATFTTRTAHALITRSSDANGDPNPSHTAGGVAYVGIFGASSYHRYRPAWIYSDRLGNGEANIAEATSHEIGHNLGLSHDGQTDGTEYYRGHGTGDISWGPLMGTGYQRNVTQWCQGEYYLANNTQNDLTTLANKISYRPDDHGNTAYTATPLAITERTNIVSTTPENDPANTNRVNKGVLERNTDVDVFSFVTGTGPIRLAVNPWIMASGTRGGNLDLLLELYDDTGARLLTNNPPAQTTALIQTNLNEGLYYLHVRNSGAGDPFSASPTGYTPYGSLGQYFISGYVTEAVGFVIPPLAELQITNFTSTRQTSLLFHVTYYDNEAIDVTTIDDNDLRVTGPNGYDQLAHFVGLNEDDNGTPRTATYAIFPPSGDLWSYIHNGTYTVFMRSNQVADTEGAYATAGPLGQLQVTIPVLLYFAGMDTDPGWDLEPDWQYGPPQYDSQGPTRGFTGDNILGYNLSGNYPSGLSVKYATTPPINCLGATGLTLQFQRWLRTRSGDSVSIQVSTNGTDWLSVWATSSGVSDSEWQLVQHPVPAGVTGSPAVQFRWGQASNFLLNDIGWNLDDVELLAEGTTDTNPPAATLSVADLTQGNQSSHTCEVTYTDQTAVRLASLNSNNLLVTGPQGYSRHAEFVGANLPGDGSPITAIYAIPASGDFWQPADNGNYTITLQAGTVEDIIHNATPQIVLGDFTVAISPVEPGVLELLPPDDFNAAGTSGGPFAPDTFIYTLTNSGGSALNWSVSQTTTWLDLSATGGSLEAGASTHLTVTLNDDANHLAAGNYSGTVSFGNVTTGNGNVLRRVYLTVLPRPGELAVVPETDFAPVGLLGGPVTPETTVYTLTNTGESRLEWAALKSANWLLLSASAGELDAGESTSLMVSLDVTGLEAGSYTDTLDFINLTTGDDPISRSVMLTIHPPPEWIELTVTPNNPDWGEVSPASGTYPVDEWVELTAIPAAYCQFREWSGDVSSTNNPLPLSLSSNLTVQAVFDEIMTTNHPTPLWWLATHGYTNAWETAATEIGANGMAVWQSYIAGLDPNDPASQLRLESNPLPMTNAFVLSWAPVPGRVYTIWSSTNASAYFMPIPEATDLPASINCFTNTEDWGAPRFYLLEVRKP
jgi:hypothetical protein